MSKEKSQTSTGGRDATTAVIPGRFALSVGKPDIPTPKGWQWVKLTDVARLESGHTPSRQRPEYWDGGISWVGIKDATSNHGRVIGDTYQHCSQLGIDNSSARVLPANTVCLSRTASVGYVVVMGKPMATSQDFVNWVCSDAIDYRYLASIFVAERDSLFQFSRGTTHQTIYYPEVKAFHVCLPPIDQQKRIADIIWSMNDKIELNRQINQTLEQIAQTILKSWFVDFEPVKAKIEAKAAGRDPDRAAMCAISGKLEPELDRLPPEQYHQLAATADLFPDELVESELGLIPVGWEVGTLADLCVLNAKSWGTKTIPAQVHYVDLANTKNGEISDVQIFSDEEAPSRARRVLRSGDTIIGTVRPGNRSFALIGSFGPMLTGSTGFAVLSPKTDKLRELVFMLATSDLNIDRLIRLADGAAYPAVRPEVVVEEQCIIPPDGLEERFQLVAGPLFDQILANRESFVTLATLRDTLLPKLLSGELSIDEIQSITQVANAIS